MAGATLALGVAWSLGCSPAFRSAFAQGLAQRPTAAFAGRAAKIMAFGGEDHDTYLGCLSCSAYDSDSIFNEYSPYGSSFSSTSIFNHFSPYGSPYSSESACNPYATDPPVIVDREGHFYGRLTLNHYRHDAIDDAKLVAWLAAVCQDA